MNDAREAIGAAAGPPCVSVSGRLGRIVVARLGPGSDLLDSLKEIATREGIRSGLILGGAASLRKAVLRNPRGFPKSFPITDEARIYTPIEGPLELLAISGNIACKDDGSLVVHAHVAVSAGCPEASVYGGHLVEGATIYSTGEIVLAEVEGMELRRKLNEETQAFELVPQGLSPSRTGKG